MGRIDRLPGHAQTPTAENRFHVTLPPHPFANRLLPDSPFDINTTLRPDAPDLPARLRAMQEAGIKWERAPSTWWDRRG
jgi:hypothetical protein